MAIATNFANLKGDSINIKSVTNNTDAGADNIITLAQYLPDGTEVSGTEQPITVNGGVRGVSLHSGTPTPIGGIAADSSIGTDAVANSIVGDIFLETDEDRLYERVADNPGETWRFLSDFTGDRGASITNVTGTPEAVQFVDSDGVDVGAPLNLKGEKGDDGDISASSIDALSDVDTTTIDPGNGDILTFDGSNWVSQTPTIAPSATGAIPLFQTGNAPANSVFAFTSAGVSPAVSGGLKIYGNGDLPPGNRIGGGITNFNTGNDATAAITISRIDSDGDLIDLIAPITFTITGSTQTLTITNFGTEISDADYTTSTLSKTDFFLTTNGAYTVTGDIIGPTSFTTTVPIGGEQILPLAVTYEAGVAVRHNDGTTDNWYRTYAGVDTAVDATSFPNIDTTNWEVY